MTNIPIGARSCTFYATCSTRKTLALLEGSDKLARDAFVHSVKVFTSLVLFYASIISHNSGAPTDISVGAPYVTTDYETLASTK